MGPHLYRSLIEGLRKQGYIEGRNLVVERRYADAHFERVAVIAKELGDLKLDAIGFMSYGESLRHSYFRTAYYLDQIAKGVKPEALPVEQPTKFELIIN